MSPTDEFVLEPAHWPDMPSAHRAFLEAAIPKLRADERLVGLAAGGSFISRTLDEHSDLDLVAVSRPEVSSAVLRDGPDLARRLGPLLATFPGDHVREPRLFISLYGPPLLHVDLKFVSTEDLAHRVEDPVVLWDRGGVLRSALGKTSAVYPLPRLQWIEDRFWVWVHYIATKIARGELFEAIDALEFVRARVLGPLILTEAGAQPNGFARPAVLRERVDGDDGALQRAASAARPGDASKQSRSRAGCSGLPRKPTRAVTMRIPTPSASPRPPA